MRTWVQVPKPTVKTGRPGGVHENAWDGLGSQPSQINELHVLESISQKIKVEGWWNGSTGKGPCCTSLAAGFDLQTPCKGRWKERINKVVFWLSHEYLGMCVRFKGQLWESILCFNHVGTGFQTQASTLAWMVFTSETMLLALSMVFANTKNNFLCKCQLMLNNAV